MSSIDFKGVQGALAAYKAKCIDTWGVFNKGNFMQSGSCEELLSDYLELMEQQGSRTTYTLKMYKGVEADEVTDKTPNHGSFSFTLHEAGAYSAGGMGSMGVGNNISARLAAIEKKLNAGPVKDESLGVKLGNTVLGWFEDVDDVAKIAGIIGMFMGKTPPPAVMQSVAALGGMDAKRVGANLPAAEQQDEVIELTEAQERLIQRYATVIDRLEKKDPEFLMHLEKLATLAETNPQMYTMACSFLK